MSEHRYGSVSRIREIAEGEGGSTVIIAAAGKPYYAGLQRRPAENLLEAVLTFFQSQPADYDEILIFTGKGDHLPKLNLRPGLTVGHFEVAWFFCRKEEPPISSAREPQTSRTHPDIPNRRSRRQRTVEASQMVLKEHHGSDWWNKLDSLLIEVESRCTAETGKRNLILVDSAFLRPEFNTIDNPNDAEYSTRFANLPKKCEGTQTDLAILCQSSPEAQEFLDGSFTHPVWGERDFRESQHQPLSQLKWENAEIIEFPTWDFSALWPDAQPNRTLYDALRAVPSQPPKDPIDELREMVGMKQIVAKVEEMQDTVEEEKERRARGIVPNDPDQEFALNLHTALYGPPGTGKTAVAKKLARIFVQLGLLNGDKVTEAGPTDLMSDVVGGTTNKTNALCERARGGVLFIDEIYQLTKEGSKQFGDEAVTTLLPWMDQHREELAIIFAGYEEDLKNFIQSNDGLFRRVKHHFLFTDYTDDELVQIARIMADKKKDMIAYGADAVIMERIKEFRQACKDAGLESGNAGIVEKLIEEARGARARRNRGRKNKTIEDLTLLTPDDFRSAEMSVPKQ
jgi:SpoVK/Ycf46/Vps4 family AAA+-type ATPase